MSVSCQSQAQSHGPSEKAEKAYVLPVQAGLLRALGDLQQAGRRDPQLLSDTHQHQKYRRSVAYTSASQGLSRDCKSSGN